MTHFATADDDPEFMERQLQAFMPFATALRDRWPDIAVHAANSAATLREPRSHLTLVRCGIAIYGCDPMNQNPAAHDLEPALELRSYVAAVKLAHPGDSTGYGRRFISPGETWIATVPIGYGDGIRRALTNNCDVLISGRRYPLVGTVSMDNVTVDLGPEPTIREGEPATLIGRDGPQRQTAEDLARRIGTINYEVLTGITRKCPASTTATGSRRESPARGALAADGRRLARRWRRARPAARPADRGLRRCRGGRRPTARAPARARDARARVRTVGGLRRVAGDQPRSHLAGRHAAAHRRHDRGRSAPARLHRKRDRRAPSRR